jgi:hypothetical protein
MHESANLLQLHIKLHGGSKDSGVRPGGDGGPVALCLGVVGAQVCQLGRPRDEHEGTSSASDLG